MTEVVLVDTGPLVALLDRREEYHAWASSKMTKVDQLQTCGAVLTETCFLLARLPHALLKLQIMLEQNILVCAGESDRIWVRALVLMRRYANVPMSLADGCLVALTEKIPVARVFTTDRDFLIYRRHTNQPLALIAPFVEE